MRYALLIAGVLLLVWRFRTWRAGQDIDSPRVRPVKKPSTTTDMVPCRHCGTHIPVQEAIEGRLGQYCSAAHHRSLEG
ncbi:PP0621 family protein [Rhodoferax aquaticus]|uniref:PP0621 family protein n=1 Tax=Rhodoferax aquaticus TaxID=2527691 RepID=UPI003CCA67D9